MESNKGFCHGSKEIATILLMLKQRPRGLESLIRGVELDLDFDVRS